jgi:hypothetical protein
MRLHSKALLGMLVVLLLSSTGLAATSATGTNTVAPTLAISVTVQSAVELTLGSGGSPPGTPCTINPGGGGDYNLSFGNVNGLGVGTPTCGGVTSVTASNATYATSYKLTPRFSGQSSATGSIVLTAPAFANPTILTLKEGATTGTLVAVPSAPGSAQITGLASGTAVERYLGVTVSNVSPGFAGADATTVTFSMTVP